MYNIDRYMYVCIHFIRNSLNDMLNVLRKTNLFCLLLWNYYIRRCLVVDGCFFIFALFKPLTPPPLFFAPLGLVNTLEIFLWFWTQFLECAVLNFNLVLQWTAKQPTYSVPSRSLSYELAIGKWSHTILVRVIRSMKFQNLIYIFYYRYIYCSTQKLESDICLFSDYLSPAPPLFRWKRCSVSMLSTYFSILWPIKYAFHFRDQRNRRSTIIENIENSTWQYGSDYNNKGLL